MNIVISQKLFITIFTFITICISNYFPLYLKSQTITIEELFPDFPLSYPPKLIKHHDNYYVVEIFNSRILKFNTEQNNVGQIGNIGQEPGDFYEPIDFTFDHRGNLYVLEAGNKRVQWFDKNTRPQGKFSIQSTARGFGVNSKGEVFLGKPQKGNLISVYDNGGQIIRQYGELITPSSIYGDNYKKYDEWYEVAINRIKMDTDEEDNIYVAFYHAPIIRKYTSAGELIFEKMITGSDTEKLIDIFWNVPVSQISHQGALSQNIDGVQLTMLIKDIASDGNRIYVLLGNDKIVTIDALTGVKEMSYQIPRLKGGTPVSITVDNEGSIYITTLSFLGESKCYSIQLPI